MDFESKKIWRYGDDVDTDVIIPASLPAIADWNELAEHAMEDIDTTFAPNVKAGEIMVAGKNFGCGSSREHAPGVIKAKAYLLSFHTPLHVSSSVMLSTSVCQ